MNADLLQIAGYLFGAWVSGWGCGFTVYSLRRFLDQI